MYAVSIQYVLAALAVALQSALVTEGVLRRVMLVVAGAAATPSEKTADRNLLSIAVAFVSQLLAVPVQVLVGLATYAASQVVLVAGMVVVLACLWAFADGFEVLVAGFVNSYNLVFGPVLNALLHVVRLFQGVTQCLIVVWNFVVFVFNSVFTKVIAPLTLRWPAEVAEISENAALAAFALANSLSTWVANIADCASITEAAPCPSGAVCQWQDNDVACFASVNHLSVDLMTPGLYVKRVADAGTRMLAQDCSVLSLGFGVVLAPLLDVSLYKVVHSAANVGFYGTGWILAQHLRCEHLKRGQARGMYRKLDVAVGCMPDFAPLQQLVVTGVRAAGTLVDNWMDSVLLQTEVHVFGDSAGVCANQRVGGVVLDASSVFEEGQERLRIVGTGASSTAVVSSRSVVLHRPDGDTWGVAVWPFAVDVRMGVAPVVYSATEDALADETNEPRSDGARQPTGFLGCACVDHRLQCASVPYLGAADEDAANANASTIHRVRMPDGAGVACGARTATVQVTPLRFSRRRLGAAVARGADASADDVFDLLGQQGEGAVHAEADAAVFVHGWCGDAGCVEQCVPWCMGVHAAGEGSHNMTLFPAARWEEWLSVRQSDCGLETYFGEACGSGSQTPAEVELADGVVRKSACGLGTCAPSELAVTAVPALSDVLPPGIAAMKSSRVAIRISGQPFVVAGDTMLTVDDSSSEPVVVVSRLLSAGGIGGPEQLTLASNARTLPVTDCAAADSACVAGAARNGALALPRSVFASPPAGMPAAQSEWAVHWASNPAVEVYADFFTQCRTAATDARLAVIVDSAYGRARVWTAKTTRAADMLASGAQAAAQPGGVAYMLVPGFFNGTEISCDAVVNLRVVGVEYVDRHNVLVSVLAGRARDFDDATQDLLPGAERTYNYYWLNPNRHDCFEPEEASASSPSNAFFSCWRSEAAGMWTGGETSRPSAGARGQLCPQAQRMPKLGSIAAEIFIVKFAIASAFVETAFAVAPALAAEGLPGVVDLFRPRLKRLTLHSALDTGGARVFSFAVVETAMTRFAHLSSEVLLRVVRLLSWVPGIGSTERVAVGAAHVAAHASLPALALTDYTRIVRRVQELPVREATSAGGGVFAASSLGGMSSFANALRQASGRLRATFGLVVSIARETLKTVLIRSTALSAASATVGTAQRAASDAALRASDTRVVLRDAVLKSVVELRPVIRSSFLDGLLWQCYGLGQIWGSDTVLGRATRQACSLNADIVETALTVTEVLFVDYPLVNCLCKFDESERAFASAPGALNDVAARCLPLLASAELHAWALDLVFTADNTARQDLCFAAMDTANLRLERALDAPAARMYRLAETLGEALQAFASVIPGAGSAACESFAASSFSAVVIPFPVDFFMQCLHAPDCRLRCRDEYAAFEEALQGVGRVPQQSRTAPLRIESAFFSPADVEAGRDKAPFDVLDLLELRPETCAAACGRADPCALAVGVSANNSNSHVLRQAVTCLPRDIAAYARALTVHETLVDVDGDAQVSDAYAVTGFMAAEQQAEWAVVLAHSPQRSQLVLASSQVAVTVLVADSRRADPDAADPTSDDFWHSISALRVVPAMSSSQPAILVVRGRRVRLRFADHEYLWSRAVEIEEVCVQLHLRVYEFATEATVAPRPWQSWQACDDDADFVLSPEHRHVCLDDACTQELMLPRVTTALTQVRQYPDRSDLSATNLFLIGAPQIEAEQKGARLARVLGADARRALVDTGDGARLRRVAVSARGTLAAVGTEESFAARVLATHLGRGSWLQELTVDRLNGRLYGAQRHAWIVENRLEVRSQCSIDSCDACSNASNPALPYLCAAAQQCGVTRCAGTEVQVHKPLCNAGALLKESLHAQRLMLLAGWRAFARTAAFAVELVEARRSRFEIALPAETTLDIVCHAKDVTVEAGAVVASALNRVVAGVRSLDTAVRQTDFDPRATALDALTSMALTNLIANVLLLPVYQLLFVQRISLCGVSDAVLIVSNLLHGDGPEDALLTIGSVDIPDNFAQAQAAGSAVSVCVSDYERALVHDADIGGLQVRIGSLVREVVDAVRANMLNAVTTAIDAALSWLAGIVRGLSDVVQVVDWDACKLPPVAGVPLDRCACGDKPLQIPHAARTSSYRAHAFWCSGWLVFPDPAGGTRLVWNPYSLEQLLALANVDAYARCTTSESEDCSALRPRSQVLEAQGVEVLQVATRCRANFAQKKWDDGALVLGAFTLDELAAGTRLDPEVNLPAAFIDRVQGVRARAAAVAQNIGPAYTSVRVEERVHACLAAAAAANDPRHRCAELLQPREAMFEFERGNGDVFSETDACAGTAAIDVPLMLWSGARGRRVPVAVLHEVRETEAARTAAATAGISGIAADIREYFKALPSPAELEAEIRTELATTTLSLEGDELHQAVDCAVLGPYASADMLASVQTAAGGRVPVPQFHRGSPRSRAFQAPGALAGQSGSPVRREVMQAAARHASQSVDEHIVASTVTRFAEAEAALLSADDVPPKLLCECVDGQPSIDCCTARAEASQWTRLSDVVFPAEHTLRDLQDATDQLHVTLIADTVRSVVRKLWTDASFLTDNDAGLEAVPLSAEVRDELRRAHLFERTVLSYSSDETPAAWGARTLWQHCTDALSTAFATLPLLSREALRELGFSDLDVAVVDVRERAYDATQGTRAPARHAQEQLVRDVLERAREESPLFWSHAHRYVPTDSLWCEERFAEQSVLPGAHAAGNAEQLRAMTLEDTPSVARMASTCACGWFDASKCVVHADLCVPLDTDKLESAGVDDKTAAWQDACANGYSTRAKLFDVLAVLAADAVPGWQERCLWTEPTAAWGLMTPDNTKAWLNSGAAPDFSDADTELAHAGPSGLRAGMLAQTLGTNTGAESLREFALRAGAGHNLSRALNFALKHSVAQPVCRSTLGAQLTQSFEAHFADVFLPVAQAVHVQPADAACQRWTVEHALAQAYNTVLGAVAANISDPRANAAADAIRTQGATNATWRLRCVAQLEQLGACALRGVLDIAAPDAQRVPEGCLWSFASDADAASVCGPEWWVSQGCVLRCGDKFHDPCLCADTCWQYQIPSSGPCPESELDDPLALVDDGARLSSLADASGQRTVPHVESHLGALHARVLSSAQRQADAGAESLPLGHADTAIDYWDAAGLADLPGYHPSRPCFRTDARTRGFEESMTRSLEHDWIVDARVRNATAVASEFGAGHALCDASAFTASGSAVDSYVLESRWPAPDIAAGRADPAVPRPADPALVDDMQQFSQPAPDQWHTAVFDDSQPDGAPTDIRRPAAGLLRGWARWSGLNSAGQSAVDERWPLPGTTRAAFATAEASCAPPPLRTCKTDDECCIGCDLRCKFTTGPDGEPVGLCVHRDTCSQHAHCAEDELCSGQGSCVRPQVRVENNLDVDADFRLQAGACTTPTAATSKTQGVSDFAHANGMCSMRNWFHYLDTVRQLPPQPGASIIEVEDRLVSRTDEPRSRLLSELSVLELTPDACDRDYEHSELKACVPGADGVSTLGVLDHKDTLSTTTVVNATRTRVSSATAATSFRFCNLRDLAKRSGFLNPYEDAFSSETDTMRRVPDTLRRCVEFEACPRQGVDVDGERVARRRVLPASLPAEAEIAGPTWNLEATRPYCMLDAELCGGGGMLVGPKCDNTQPCVVDPLVAPVAAVLFGGSAFKQPELLLEDVRTNCPSAFPDPSQFNRFRTVFSSTYSGATGRRDAAQLVNLAFFSLFGIDPTNERGELTEAAYVQHARCLEWLAERLSGLRSALGNVYRDGATAEQLETQTVPTPGRSLYLVQEHALLPVGALRLWRCAVVADASSGFRRGWLGDATTYVDAVRPNTFACGNHDTPPEQNMAMSRRFQTADTVFVPDDAGLEPSVPRQSLANEIVHDIDSVVVAAIERLGLASTADLFCVGERGAFDQPPALSDATNVLHQLTLAGDKAPLDRGFTVEARAAAEESDALPTDASLFTAVRAVLLGDKVYNLDWYLWSLREMLDEGVLDERGADDFMQRQVSADDTFFPLYELTNLRNLDEVFSQAKAAHARVSGTMDAAKLNAYVKNAADSSACPAGTLALRVPEYSLQQPFQCSTVPQSNVLRCDGLEILQGRTFLQREEALILVLRLVRQLIFTVPDLAVGHLRATANLDTQALLAVDATPSQTAANELNKFVASKNFECSSEGDVEFFVETSRANRLLRECVADLQQPAAWRVPHGGQLALDVPASVLRSAFLPSFDEASTAPDFLESLVSKDNVRDDVLPARYALCFMRVDGPEVINPYWAGDFDWRVGCDTAQDLDNVRHYATTCAVQSDAIGDIDVNADPCARFPAYDDLLKNHTPVIDGRSCAARDEEIVWRAISPLMDGLVPLCSRAFQPAASCARRHGALHGHRGGRSQTLNDGVLVEPETGIWKAGHRAWRGRRSAALPGLAALRVLGSDIAGHRLVFEVGADARLALRCLDLHERGPFEPCGLSADAWMRNLEQDWVVQHRALAHAHTPADGLPPWSCPLQWLAAWSGLRQRPRSASAKVPSPERNAARFWHLTGESPRAHPTVLSVRPPAHVRPAFFLGDTHACVSPLASFSQCQGAAVLADVRARLADPATWQPFTRVGPETCARVLDWPHENTTLRDGTEHTLANPAECNVADRLPAFAVRYKTPAATAHSRNPRPRACRSGRLQRLAELNGLALGTGSTDLAAQLCRPEPGGPLCDVLVQDAADPRLVRAQYTLFDDKAPRRADFSRSKAAKWAQCDPPAAAFRDADGTRHSLPADSAGALMSVGRAFALSTQRLVAAEITRTARRVLCPDAAAGEECAAFSDQLDTSKQPNNRLLWNEPDGPALLGKVLDGSAFSAGYATTPGAETQHPPELAALWTTPWVFCNASGCRGTVAKDAWLDPATRAGTCAAAVNTHAASDRQARVSFCLLTRRTRELCTKIASWREAVRHQLCVAAGLCPSQVFAYSPTAFDVSNGEFVHTTVADFYAESGRECPAESQSSEVQQRANAALLDTCGATAVNRLVGFLRSLRSVAHTIAQLMWYVGSATLDFLMIVAYAVRGNLQGVEAAATQLWHSVRAVFNLLADAIEPIFGVLFRAIFSSGRMQQFEELVRWLCGAVKWFETHVVKDLVCDVFIDWFADVVRSIGQFLVDIDSIKIITVRPFQFLNLDDKGDTIKGWADALENLALCDPPDERSCGESDEDADDEPPAGTLPNPTRCWASYVTFFGDERTLACTKADTCQRSPTDPTLVVCDACPAPDAGITTERFGCHPATKMCTCGVVRAAPDSCRSNADCLRGASELAPAATCGFTDAALAVRDSAGVLPCGACVSQPVCVVAAAQDALGRCGCALRPTPFAQCSRAGAGAPVYPASDALCLYTRDGADQAAAAVTFAAASAAACAAFSPGSIFCTAVPDAVSTQVAPLEPETYLAVGFELAPRRRLLADTAEPHDAGADLSALTRDPICADALAGTELPRTRAACLQRLAASNASVAALGLPLPACAFCSAADAVHALQTQPFAVLQLLARVERLPALLHDHTPVGGLWRAAGDAARAVAAAAAALRDEVNGSHADVTVSFTVNTTETRTPASRAARRLAMVDALGAAVEDALREAGDIHDRYASAFSESFAYRYPDSGAVGAAWAADWPPRPPAADANCSLAADSLAVLVRGATGLRDGLRAAISEDPPRPPPTLPLAWDAVRPKRPASASEPWTPTETAATTVPERLFNAAVAAFFQLINFHPATLTAMAQDAKDSIASVLVCDYEGIQTCTSWRVYLVHGLVIVAGSVLAASAAGAAIGQPVVAAVAFALAGPGLLYLCYGYGVLCVPMLPACVLTDLVASARAVFPEVLTVPAPLFRPRDASNNPCYAYRPTPACVRACADAPLRYDAWLAPAAWWAAELGADRALGALINTDDYNRRAAVARAVLRDVDADLRAAHRACAVATAYMLAPYLLLALVLFALAAVLAQTLSTLVFNTVLVWGAWFAAVAAAE